VLDEDGKRAGRVYKRLFAPLTGIRVYSASSAREGIGAYTAGLERKKMGENPTLQPPSEGGTSMGGGKRIYKKIWTRRGD